MTILKLVTNAHKQGKRPQGGEKIVYSQSKETNVKLLQPKVQGPRQGSSKSKAQGKALPNPRPKARLFQGKKLLQFNDDLQLVTNAHKRGK